MVFADVEDDLQATQSPPQLQQPSAHQTFYPWMAIAGRREPQREMSDNIFIKSPPQSSMHLKYFRNWAIALQEQRYSKFHKLESGNRVPCSHSRWMIVDNNAIDQSLSLLFHSIIVPFPPLIQLDCDELCPSRS